VLIIFHVIYGFTLASHFFFNNVLEAEDERYRDEKGMKKDFNLKGRC